ncbi:MAG TPA: peptidylprolyl isomerase [Stenomitos sp.]
MKNSMKALLGVSAALVIGTTSAGCSYLAFSQGAYVATVNGHKVTTKEYDHALEQAKKQYAARFGVDFSSDQGKQMLAGLQKSIIQQLTERELLLQQAEKLGLKATQAEIDAKIAEVKKQFPDDATFKKTLKDFGISEADLKDQVTKGVTIEKLQKEATKDLTVTDQQIKEFYAKNKAQFTHTEEVNASHILIKFDEQAKDKAKDEARALAKIKEIQAKLKAGGDFAELAKANSEDPGSKDSGGNLGFFGKGRMVPEFEKAAFALKEGQVSEPVKTNFGYHLIKRGEMRPARTESLAEVTPQIREQLVGQQRNGAFQKYVDSLKKDAKIEIKAEYQPKESGLPAGHPDMPAGHPDIKSEEKH